MSLSPTHGDLPQQTISDKFNKIIETIDTEEDPQLLVYLDILDVYIQARINNIITDAPEYEILTN